MAFINKRTFDIVQDPGNCLREDDWFYADDLLADALQALNVRGYRTAASCVTPAYCRTTAMVIRNVRDNTGCLPDIREITKAFRARFPNINILSIERVGQRDYRIIRRDYTEPAVSITFEEDVYFKKIPKEAEYKDKTLIRKFFPKMNGFDLIDAQTDYCRQLFNWTCTLPMNLLLAGYTKSTSSKHK